MDKERKMISSKERIAELKFLCRQANVFLNHYKALNNQQSKGWEGGKVEVSIQRLKRIIRTINRDLHPSQVELFCTSYNAIQNGFPQNSNEKVQTISGNLFKRFEIMGEVFRQVKPMFVLFEIARLAPEQNILYDITWLHDGVMGDTIDVALGVKKIETFGRYLPDKINEVEKRVIPFCKQINNIQSFISILTQCLQLSKRKEYLSSNILLITVTESLTRECCKFIYQQQNPTLSIDEVDFYIYQKFTSLESLILKGDWKNDFAMSVAKASTFYNDVSEPSLNYHVERMYKHHDAEEMLQSLTRKMDQTLKLHGTISDEELKIKVSLVNDQMEKLIPDMMKEEEKNIKINLRVLFNFLIRKYKDDRNLIIHGNFEPLNHKWKNYINFSAIVRVVEVFEDYKKLYTN